MITPRGVTLELIGGEVHALVDENDAGKSTLWLSSPARSFPKRGKIEIGGGIATALSFF